MSNILRVDAAYAAGWMDAEGCLTTSKRASGYYPLVQFNTVDLPLVIWFKELFGGMTWEARTPTGRPCFYWALSGEQVDKFLKSVYPFLVLKKPQAALLFKLRKMNQQMRLSHVRNQRLPLTESLSNKIRLLNQSDVGPVGSPRPDWSEEEGYAYAAGVIDGDGTIYCAPNPGVKLDQKRRTLTELFLNMFGGNHNKEPYENGDSKPLWRWSQYGVRACYFLGRLHKFLKIKVDVPVQPRQQ